MNAATFASRAVEPDRAPGHGEPAEDRAVCEFDAAGETKVPAAANDRDRGTVHAFHRIGSSMPTRFAMPSTVLPPVS